jgi:hypothetical protein
VRWCLMEDGTTYDEADAEMRTIVDVTPPRARQDPAPWLAAAAPEPSGVASGPAATARAQCDADPVSRPATRLRTPAGLTTSRPSRAA